MFLDVLACCLMLLGVCVCFFYMFLMFFMASESCWRFSDWKCYSGYGFVDIGFEYVAVAKVS